MSARKQLTYKDKQLIIADYAFLGSYNAVSKKWGISDNYVKNIVNKDGNTLNKVETIKRKIEYDANNFIESIQPTIKEIMATYLAEILKPEKIAKTSPKDLAIVMGILQDKFGLTLEQATKSVHNSLDGLITKLKDEPKDKPNE
jgi:hypothetical protein